MKSKIVCFQLSEFMAKKLGQSTVLDLGVTST
eukprot:COSAG01_NODE_52464_length_346_cov_1.238866_1_plen_31_part_10